MGKTFNQAKQMFVATAYGNPAGSGAAIGTIQAKTSGDGCDLILKYLGNGGNLKSSDVIPTDKILWVTKKSAEDERMYLKKWTITLDSTVNSGAVISGENYILKVSTTNYFDLSDVNEYIKSAAVHGFAGMSASDFYKKLAVSIAKNFSREIDKPIKVFIGSTEIKPETKESAIAGTASSVIIKEAEPYWKNNSFDFSRYKIDVTSNTVTVGNDEKPWATIVEADDTEYIGNGKKTIELENVCFSLASDFYKYGVKTPLSPENMVDPTKEYNYLQIHYCFIEGGTNPQKSEKDIVVVAPAPVEEGDTDGKTILNSIISALNTATGKTLVEEFDTDDEGDGD